MSEIERTEAFKQAIELVRQQDRMVQAWVGRIIVIQVGLIAAIGTLCSWASLDRPPWKLNLVTPLATLLAVLAIALVRGMTKIIRREYQWQKCYVEMVKRCEGSDPLLYQVDSKLQGLNIDGVVGRIQVLLIVAWIIFILILTAYTYRGVL